MQFRAGWYSRFHEYMKPMTEERVRLKDYYLRLCESAIPPTVSFAVKALTQINKVGKVSTEELLEYLPAALTNKTKSTVKKSIALLEKHIKKNSEKRSEILVAICSALCHESPDIQEITLKTLQKYHAFDDTRVVAEIENYVDLLSPAIRAQVPLQHDTPAENVCGVEMIEEALAIPKNLQKILGIPQLVKALKGKT